MKTAKPSIWRRWSWYYYNRLRSRRVSLLITAVVVLALWALTKHEPVQNTAADVQSVVSKWHSYHTEGMLDNTGGEDTRFESTHVWRQNMGDASESVFSRLRKSLPRLPQVPSKSDYLRQPLPADYAKGADKCFLIVKCGGNTIWKRLPVVMMTLLTRFPNFQIYSDVAGSVFGHQIVDALANVTRETFYHYELKMHRFFKYIHYTHGVYDTSDTSIRGGWWMDKYKWIPMVTHAYHKSPHSDWFILVDDDSYFLADNLLEFLKPLDPNKPWYLGSARTIENRLFAHGGSTVVLSRKALELTVGKDPNLAHKYEPQGIYNCCGDKMLADMLADQINLNLTREDTLPQIFEFFQGKQLHDVRVHENRWCRPLSSFHHLKPHEYEILWEYERLMDRKTKGKFTYCKYYQDFVMPYIDETVKHWDSGVRDIEYSKAVDDDSRKKYRGKRPWHSSTECQRACGNDAECVAWRYLPQKSYCGLGYAVQLGRPVHKYFKDSDSLGNVGATSGWMIDRIRDIRHAQKCDPLFNEDVNAPDDKREGWWLRQSPLAREAIRLRDSIQDFEPAEYVR